MSYPYSNTNNVAFTGTSQSQDLSNKAKQIKLSATAACYISFDVTTVTATNGFFIPADTTATFDVLFPAQISVIQSSGAGTLSVMELADVSVGLNVTVSDTYTGDTNLVGTVEDTFDGDSSILATIASTLLGDASLTKASIATTFTGDSAIVTLNVDTFSGDASIATEYAATFTSDSHLDV